MTDLQKKKEEFFKRLNEIEDLIEEGKTQDNTAWLVVKEDSLWEGIEETIKEEVEKAKKEFVKDFEDIGLEAKESGRGYYRIISNEISYEDLMKLFKKWNLNQ